MLRRVIPALLVLLLLAGCGNAALSGPGGNGAFANEPGAGLTPPVDVSPDPTPTAPESPPAEGRTLDFLFFSDTQPDPGTGDYSGVGELLSQAIMRAPDAELVLFGGDSVNDGGDEKEWDDFWQAVGPSLSGVETAAVSGNHDNYALLAERFDFPTDAPAGPGEGFFYSIVRGPVFFLMLDSNVMGAANQREIDWVRQALQSRDAASADWRIAVMHHPMWPLTDHPRDLQRAETMREHFLPLFYEYGVDLILCGHQHVYSRTIPMSGETAADDGRGLVQIMAASGDKATYTIGERDFLAASGAAPNYLRLIADKARLTVTAYDAGFTEIDSFVLDKP